jgi:putative Mg2+ transporter-C (MgtC) family protein
MHVVMSGMIDILKLLIAALCGSLVGKEKKDTSGTPGMVPSVLLATGACLLIIVMFDPVLGVAGGMILYVALGAGFIAAGVIISARGSRAGIESAARLWISAMIGAAIGAGFFLEAAAVCLIAYFALTFLNH